MFELNLGYDLGMDMNMVVAAVVWELTIHMLVIMIWDSVLVIWDLGMEMGGYAMPAPQGNEMW